MGMYGHPWSRPTLAAGSGATTSEGHGQVDSQEWGPYSPVSQRCTSLTHRCRCSGRRFLNISIGHEHPTFLGDHADSLQAGLPAWSGGSAPAGSHWRGIEEELLPERHRSLVECGSINAVDKRLLSVRVRKPQVATLAGICTSRAMLSTYMPSTICLLTGHGTLNSSRWPRSEYPAGSPGPESWPVLHARGFSDAAAG